MCGRREVGKGIGDALSFPGAIKELVEAVGHHEMHTDEVVDWPEPTNGQVALVFSRLRLALTMRDTGS